MKREFLKELGLEKDVIDKIMDENGNDIESARRSEADKFSTERDTLTTKANDLQGQLDARDADIKDLQGKLTAAQTDAGKLTEATQQLNSLQAKYDTERQEWTQKQAQQAYEFAVKQKANELKFSSTAARKDFVREAINAQLKMDGDTLLGYNDFVDKYKAGDPGAFVAEPVKPDDGNGAGESSGAGAPPTIVLPKNNPKPADTGTFGFHFNGVRPAPKE
ncbi:MAG: phage scaffolding protein [Clostridiales bacterium]|nr:phage scaffolding protein [Clostridiales bacterium]